MSEAVSPQDIERLLPHDAEVEEALLGELLLWPDDAGLLILPTLRPEDFYGSVNRDIARFLMQSIEDARPADAVTLNHHLRHQHIEAPDDLIPRLMDAAPTGANIAGHVEILKELSLKRGVIAAGQRFMEEGRNGKRVVDVLADHRVRVEDLERDAAGAGDLRSWTAPDLLAADIKEPISLVGNHLFDQGGLSLTSGKGGLGKSNLMLALCVDLAIGGREWLRTALPAEGCRTMYLWGEGGDYFAKKRLELLEAEARQAKGCLVVVPKEVTPDLRDPSAIGEMKGLLDRHKPHLVVIDHLSEWTGGMDDGANAEMKVFLRVITGLRRYCGAHFNVIQHNRKPGENSQRGDVSEVRGATALPSACDTVLMLDPEPGDRIRVTWSKVKNAGKPEAMIAKYEPSTGRYVIETTTVSDARTSAERIKETLFRAGEKLTLKQLVSGSGLADKTCRNNLSKLIESGEVEETKGIGFPNLYGLALEHR